jgi:1-phosphofructokinase family hexose kinase
MFICVSPNPAIDKRLKVPRLATGQVNRACTAQTFPGGKSTHVAVVLRTLGESPVWTGLTGGSTGSELVTGLSALGIHAHPYHIARPTRTNLEIVEDRGTVTEILEPGAAPSAEELDTFEKTCEALFAQGREEGVVIFSGSLPAGVAPDFYTRLIARSHQFGCRAFLDASSAPLRLALAAKPQFVKPNREEAAHLLGTPIESLSAASLPLRKLLSLGAGSAALSLGADGLLFCPAVDAPIVFTPGISPPVRSPCSRRQKMPFGLPRPVPPPIALLIRPAPRVSPTSNDFRARFSCKRSRPIPDGASCSVFASVAE